jgi:AAA15 family ATPase/GTPase
LKNFKSIRKAELDILPITVLAGANSAGKSSLLQPILMMKQTLETVRLDSLCWQGANVTMSSPEQIVPRFLSGDARTLSITVENKEVSATSFYIWTWRR